MSGSVETVPRRAGVVVDPERAELSDRIVGGPGRCGCDVVEARPDDADRLPWAGRGLIDLEVDAGSAIGGDGTQRTVAGTLADVGRGLPLAVVPGGTVDLLAKVFGVDDVDVAAPVRHGPVRHTPGWTSVSSTIVSSS